MHLYLFITVLAFCPHSEQYDAFVRFSRDQIEKRYSNEDMSCECPSLLDHSMRTNSHTSVNFVIISVGGFFWICFIPFSCSSYTYLRIFSVMGICGGLRVLPMKHGEITGIHCNFG